mgnify:CR=1 FL=1
MRLFSPCRCASGVWPIAHRTLSPLTLGARGGSQHRGRCCCECGREGEQQWVKSGWNPTLSMGAARRGEVGFAVRVWEAWRRGAHMPVQRGCAGRVSRTFRPGKWW